MVRSVVGAFSSFRKNFVDLDPELTKNARTSRDYLFTQIKNLARTDSNFPEIDSVNSFLGFGSFARKTKIQPLDDIDFLVVLKGDSLSVHKSYLEPYTYRLKLVRPPTLSVQSLLSPYLTWKTFADDDDFINSTKVLNKIKSALSGISNYQKAEIRKKMQVVTLQLKSYPWNYDIVPAVPVYENSRLYFLIPNGHGNWIATNPKIDADNTTNTNLQHNGNFLPLLRMLKYWNGRNHKPRLSSYYFETLAIKVFSNRQKITNLHEGVRTFFDICPNYLSCPCPDPKGLGPSLDKGLDSLTKDKVRRAMVNAANCAHSALMHEAIFNHELAINCWQKVFGSNFPNYG